MRLSDDNNNYVYIRDRHNQKVCKYQDTINDRKYKVENSMVKKDEKTTTAQETLKRKLMSTQTN